MPSAVKQPISSAPKPQPPPTTASLPSIEARASLSEPPAESASDTYSVWCTDNRLPRLRAGQCAMISTEAPLRKDGVVAVRWKGEEPECIELWKLATSPGQHIALSRENPDEMIIVSMDSMQSIHQMIGVYEEEGEGARCAKGIASSETLDAAILAACAAFDAADRDCEAVVNETFEWRHDHDPTPASVQRTAMDFQVARAEELAAMKPATLAGHAARAASALGSSLRFGSDGPDDAVSSDDALNYVPGGLVPAIVRDLAELATATAIDPDAELIRLCAEFNDLTLRFRGLHGDGPQAHLKIVDNRERDAAIDPLNDRRDVLLDQICELRATTLAGIRARGQMFAIYDPEQAMPHGPYPDAMLWALIRDLSEPADLPVEIADPDAALIADCAAFDALELEYVRNSRHNESLCDDTQAAQAPLVRRMFEARPTTPEGHAARARSVILWAPDRVREDTAGDTDEVLIHAVLRDLAGDDAVAAAQYPRSIEAAPAAEGEGGQ